MRYQEIDREPAANRHTLHLVEQQVERIAQLRSLHQTKPVATLPVRFADAIVHQPIDPFLFIVGEWTETPWRGVTCFGVSLSRTEVVIICEVEHPVRMRPQEHGPWTERLVMDRGELYEHTTGEIVTPGSGVYVQPAGAVHEPEFLTPARCIITWSLAGKELTKERI